MSVSFAASTEDHDLISQIVDRAAGVARTSGIPFDRRDAAMDITAVHANGCPLLLADLLKATPFDFNHDVFGIFRHIDRATGELRNCFLPRCAVPEGATR